MLTLSEIKKIKQAQKANKNTENLDEVDHTDHRARMKKSFLASGFDAFSDVEILEFLLFYAIRRKDTNPMAHRLLDSFGSFDRVLEAPYYELAQIKGLGEHSAIYLSMFLKLAKAYSLSKPPPKLKNHGIAREYTANLFLGSFVEEFYVLCLNNKNAVLKCTKINEGTASSVHIDTRKITEVVLASHCDRVILAHNHPKSTPKPSDEDVAFTYNLMASFTINNIDILDHIIVTGKETFSMAKDGNLRDLKKDVCAKYLTTKEARERFLSPKDNSYLDDYCK